MCVTSLLYGPRADLWPFYGFLCKRFSLCIKVYPWTTQETRNTHFKWGRLFFIEILWFSLVTETIGFFPTQILIFWMLRNNADAQISSLGYLCSHIHLRVLWSNMFFYYSLWFLFIYLFCTEYFNTEYVDRLSWVSHWLLTYPPPPPQKKTLFITSHNSLCTSVWNHFPY